MITQRNLADVYHSLNTFNISMKYNGLTQGSDKVNAITIPVLVLRGDEDLVITDEMTKRNLRGFQRSGAVCRINRMWAFTAS
ncbi:hypothetical protein GCM10020331_059680 [Ectobacillus funiculus]